jgi:prolyl oligopeptidase
MRATLSLLAGLLVLNLLPAPAPSAEEDASDPYLWLEELRSDRALDWVRSENAKTQAVLEGDVRYADIYAQELAIAAAKDRIPEPQIRGNRLYNFWQDTDHVRGIWRTASFDQYRRAEPAWQTVLDLDAVAQQEQANWYWKGADCRMPAERDCLLSLSDGGEDAVTVREFDLRARRFVTGGFQLPSGKQEVSWLDRNRVLVARDWGEGSMTPSGYPFIAKVLGRGQALATAREIFRGRPSDVGVELLRLDDGDGHAANLILRAVTFFESEKYLLVGSTPRRLALPLKAEIAGLVANRLLIKLNESWSVDGRDYPQGSLVSIELSAATAQPLRLQAVPVYTPTDREALGDVACTHGRIIVTLLHNVQGRALIFSPGPKAGWTQQALALPDYAAVDIASTDPHSERAILELQGFLSPPGLWLLDAATHERTLLKSLPARFDATGEVIEQFEVASSDGVRIPYFVVHPGVMRLDGQNPTLIYAYGGFQVSETPSYLPVTGKLWLEKGGVFVLANIRGGGEFGPGWHEQGRKLRRQIIYDDFAAVARDLIARGISSPRRLGIEGGSNGGLLMGVEYTQHPELWNAVDIQVPLLDMLRYEQIAAGSSWVDEYGSVSNPAEAEFLAHISPYANLRRGEHYPEALIWTTTKDDRVGPQHARKFAARLAEYGIPYLYYEVVEGGHGSGANLPEEAHTEALEMTYLTRKLMDP